MIFVPGYSNKFMKKKEAFKNMSSNTSIFWRITDNTKESIKWNAWIDLMTVAAIKCHKGRTQGGFGEDIDWR